MRERLWTKDFILLGMANLLMFGSFFLMMPTLPLFVIEELGGRENQVGLITGLFTVAAVLVRPWSGLWLDRMGRRKVMLIALVLFALVTAGYFTVSGIGLLLILRLLHGGVFGVASTASGTVAADLIPASRRGEGLGYFGTFVILAMIVGPALGLAIVHRESYAAMFSVSVALAALAAMIAAAVRYPERVEGKEGNVRLSFPRWKTMIEPRAVPYSVSLLGLAVIFGGIISFISLYAVELGNADLAGGYFFVYALALVAARVFAGKIHDRLGPDRVVYPGLVVYALGLVLLGLAQGPWLFYAAAALIGWGYGSIQPSIQAMIIQEVPENRRGAATATFFMALDIGIGTGAFLLGFVVEWLGYRGMFLSCVFFLAVSGFLYRRARRWAGYGEPGGEQLSA